VNGTNLRDFVRFLYAREDKSIVEGETFLNTLLLIFAMLLQQTAPAQPAGVITGHVRYADETPYTKSMINLQAVSEPGQPVQASMFYGAFTGTNGDFRIANIPPGRYAMRTGDSAAYYPGVAALSEATILTVASASVTNNLNFVLPAALTGFRVSGRVIRPSSQPNPPNEVRGASETRSVSGPVAADGSFELLHVLPGTYSFTAVPPGGIQPVSVLVDRDIRGIELVMPKLFDITGTVRVEGRSSLAGMFDTGNGPPVGPTFDGPIGGGAAIQPDGTFKTALIEGEYRILADHLPPGYYIKSLTSGERDLLVNRLEVAASDKPVHLTMTLEASSGVKVSGNVTGLAGEKSAARVTLVSTTSNNNTVDTAINSDGSFTLAKVLPGAYTARVVSTSSVSSPPVVLVIPNKNVSDLAIAVPAPVAVAGRVTVDGNGSPPKFTLYLAHGVGADWNPAPTDPAFEALRRNAAAGGLQLIQLALDALPDGSFKIQLPAGNYRIATPRSSIPSPYVLRSLTYGGANLLREPLVISDKESPELQVGFGTTAANPWSRVSGRVTGLDPGTGPFRVALEGNVTSTIEAPVNPDGTFEFASVLQNASYTARLRPENKAASSPRVSVANKDVANVEIVVPREREISGRAVVEGSGPLPNFALSLSGSSSIVTVLVKPDPSGEFRIKLPEDERDVTIASLPLGYQLKSLSYGTTDLRACVRGTPPRCSYPPLKIGGGSAAELLIKFTNDPAIPFGKISGRLTGLSPDAGDVRLVLSDAASFNSFEETIRADGSFAFPKLPQGVYVPSLTGGVRSSLLTPSIISVEGADAADIEIAVPGGSTKRDVASSAEVPTGARISEMGAANRVAGSEAAAVSTLRTINTAEVTFLASSRGKFGSLSQMIEAQLLPSNFTGVVTGYRFGVLRVSDGSDFVLAAIPDASGVARYAYYTTPDGVVRYSTIDALTPSGQNGLPVR
jgi:hypothetical protein